jgi:hypothetical protein
MARIGHASEAAALRYQHVLDSQDGTFVVETMGLERAARAADRDSSG